MRESRVLENLESLAKLFSRAGSALPRVAPPERRSSPLPGCCESADDAKLAHEAACPRSPCPATLHLACPRCRACFPETRRHLCWRRLVAQEFSQVQADTVCDLLLLSTAGGDFSFVREVYHTLFFPSRCVLSRVWLKPLSYHPLSSKHYRKRYALPNLRNSCKWVRHSFLHGESF
jgi:hypothetical protein